MSRLGPKSETLKGGCITSARCTRCQLCFQREGFQCERSCQPGSLQSRANHCGVDTLLMVRSIIKINCLMRAIRLFYFSRTNPTTYAR